MPEYEIVFPKTFLMAEWEDFLKIIFEVFVNSIYTYLQDSGLVSLESYDSQLSNRCKIVKFRGVKVLFMAMSKSNNFLHSPKNTYNFTPHTPPPQTSPI